MSVTTGQATKALISAVSFLDQREIDHNVTDIANELQFSDFFKLTNRQEKIETGQWNYHTWVNSDYYTLLQCETVASGNNSTQITINLTSTGYVRVNDSIRFINGKIGDVRSVSTASSKDTIVVKSIDGTNLTCTALDYLAVPFTTVAEASTSVTPRTYLPVKYYNFVQAFRTTTQITDVQKAAKTEMTIAGSPYYTYYQNIIEASKFKSDISFAFLAGQFSTGSDFSTAASTITDVTSGLPKQYTRGLDQYVTTYGVTGVDVATPGTLAITDVDTVLDGLTSVKAPRQFMVVSGTKPKRAADKLWKNLGSSGVTSARLMMDGKEADLMVDKVSYGGYEIDYLTMNIFDHPQVMNYTSSSTSENLSKQAFWIPKGMANVVGGGMAPRIRSRHIAQQLQNNYGNEVIGELYSDGLAPQPTSATLKLTTDWVSYQGLECLGVQQFAKQRVI